MIEWYMIILELIGYMSLLFVIVTLGWFIFGYTIFLVNKKKTKINWIFLSINIFIFLLIIVLSIIWGISLRAPELLNGFDNTNEKSKLLLVKMTVTYTTFSIICFIYAFSFSKFFGKLIIEDRTYFFGKLVLKDKKAIKEEAVNKD